MTGYRNGRNDPCPCDMVKKFKHCCGQVGAAVTAAPLPQSPELAALVVLLSQGPPGGGRGTSYRTAAVAAGSGGLWKILSVALLRQEKDALAALRQAAELLPQDAEAHANLGAELGPAVSGRQRW